MTTSAEQLSTPRVLPHGSLVSIIVNNYNYAPFVGEAIASALAQTYEPLEVIVVDDGSTDDSMDVIGSFGHSITLIAKQNGGQGSAFNDGFRASRGEVVVFLDADDVLFPEAVEEAVKPFEREPLAKVHWPLQVIDGGGTPTGDRFPPEDPPSGNLMQLVIESGPAYDTRWLPPTSGNAWSRRFLDWALPVPEESYVLGADVYLHTLAPLFGDFGVVPKVVGSYRSHGSNNYWRTELTEERIRRFMRQIECGFDVLAERADERGFELDPTGWHITNFNYRWLQHLVEARASIAALSDEAVLLVDDGEWGPGEQVAGKRILPFTERDGIYWGPPSDDDHAFAELQRMMDEGATAIAIWPRSFWWFETYPRFNGFLETCTLLEDSEAIRIFRLDGELP